MSIFRRLMRAKKGMSTIFGALFFIILTLMGFNLMLWNFIQYDAYNRVVVNMNQRDQQAIAENLVPTNPGAANGTGTCPACNFNIWANNLGITVSLARIYILNVSPTSSAQCYGTPCIIDPPQFTNGNVPPGVINYKIQVNGYRIDDGSGYKVILVSTRGRLFTFFFPWPTVVPTGPGNLLFTTNVGPLTVYFDWKSFNYSTTTTSSNPAWVLPDGNSAKMVFWIKVANAAPDDDIKLRELSSVYFHQYGGGGSGLDATWFISDTRTTSPSFYYPYNWQTNPYVLLRGSSTGPGPFQLIKFGALAPAGGCCASFPNQDGGWVVFIGFFYLYRGNWQGQTVPFVAVKTCTSIVPPPASCY